MSMWLGAAHCLVYFKKMLVFMVCVFHEMCSYIFFTKNEIRECFLPLTTLSRDL
jgi:hypothetical protein